MKSLSAAGLVVFMTRWISVVHSDKHPVAFERKRKPVVGDWHQPTVLVEDLSSQMHDPIAIRRDDLPIGGQAYRCWLPRRGNFNGRGNFCLLDSYRSECARLIWSVPRQVKVSRGPRDSRAVRIVAVSPLHAQARERVPFHS